MTNAKLIERAGLKVDFEASLSKRRWYVVDTVCDCKVTPALTQAEVYPLAARLAKKILRQAKTW